MVQIEGTYTCVKSKEIIEHWCSFGFSKDDVGKLADSHWTMKVWNDGNLWGGQVTCAEYPEFNCVESFPDGVEKVVDHPLFGGKAKICCRRTEDGFRTVSHSDKLGETLLVEKYTDDGVTMTYTVGGKSFSEIWQRCIKVDGAYIFEKGENMEAYFEVLGFPSENVSTSMKNYKLHTCLKNSTFHMKEWFEGQVYANTLTLDKEGPIRYPDDKEGETPKRKGLITKAGNGKFVTIIKGPNGIVEEWTYTFSDYGVVGTGLEKKSGQTCKLYLKRFTDMTGTYKLTTVIGFMEFAAAMGLPAELAQELINDPTAKVIISDLGNGCMRHQSIAKKFSIDLTFKLNEEYSFHHPLLNETVKAITIKNGSTETTVFNTSKGNIVTTVHFNDTFSVVDVRLSGQFGNKVIMERSCH